MVGQALESAGDLPHWKAEPSCWEYSCTRCPALVFVRSASNTPRFCSACDSAGGYATWLPRTARWGFVWGAAMFMAALELEEK